MGKDDNEERARKRRLRTLRLDRPAVRETVDPFAVFNEWAGEADTLAYAPLSLPRR